jgi:hypothetical protein
MEEGLDELWPNSQAKQWRAWCSLHGDGVIQEDATTSLHILSALNISALGLHLVCYSCTSVYCTHPQRLAVHGPFILHFSVGFPWPSQSFHLCLGRLYNRLSIFDFVMGETRLHPKSIAVIGAGVSGIAAAVHLKREGLNVRVFERSPKAGGICESTRHYEIDVKPRGF